MAYALGDVGMRLVEVGDRERGEAWIEEGLALHHELGNKQGLGNKLSDLGRLSHEAGDAPAAARHYAESLRQLWEAATPGTPPARSRASRPSPSTLAGRSRRLDCSGPPPLCGSGAGGRLAP